MKFEIFINDETIRKAASLVTLHCKDEMFLAMIVSEPGFTYTSDKPEVIARKIYNSNLSMNVKPYKTWSPWSKVIGYASGKTIYVNTRKLDLPLKDRVENFFHETMHLLGYSHDGNKVTAFNLQTVPYKTASIFVKYLEQIGKL